MRKKLKKLKTLEENNAEAFSSSVDYFGKPSLNGVACPDCGEELYDSQPNVTLTTYPAQKTTMCKKCGYSGYRFC